MKTTKLLFFALIFVVLSTLISGCKGTQYIKVTDLNNDDSETKNCLKDGHSFESGKCIRCDAIFSDALEFELSEDNNTYIVVSAENCKDKEVIIPAEYNGKAVSAIGESAFYYSSTVKKINVPSTVEIIDDAAFHRCYNLESVVFEENSKLSSIGDDAFLFCDKLAFINIPDGVENIGGEAFRSCFSLYEIILPDEILHIGVDAFTGTGYYLDGNNWENGVLYIGNYLIKANTSFSGRCNVNEGIKLLADEAFSGCYNLKSVDISSSVERIGKSAFANCSSLEYINFQYENKLEKISEKAFKSCKSLLRINYGKSKAEWEDVTKDANWDYQTADYIVHCTDGDIPK